MKALAFGEILWDVNGNEKTIGGAPLNVLAHICRLGGESSLVSAVGSDELGRASLACLEDFGIAERYVRISPFPTGRADVVLENGIPSYEFNMPCAWDDIRLSDEQYIDIFNDDFSVFIYGTLAQRCLTSALTLEKLLDDVSATEFFFDVNLRGNFYNEKSIERGLEKATIIKMNDEELPVVASLLGTGKENLIGWLFDNTSVKKVLVSAGSSGSFCHEKWGKAYHAVASDVSAVDTVGAGDSLSAAFLYFLARGMDTGSALEKASVLADYVVTKRGAVPEYDADLRNRLSL